MNANLRRQIRTIQAQSSCAFETVAGGAAGLRPSQFTLCALGGRHCVSVCVRVHTFVLQDFRLRPEQRAWMF